MAGDSPLWFTNEACEVHLLAGLYAASHMIVFSRSAVPHQRPILRQRQVHPHEAGLGRILRVHGAKASFETGG